MTPKKTVVLMVLDGWGIGREDETNPIHLAQPKNLLMLAQNYPMTSLEASGIAIGLPWGETGNSEVGHLTLGAGKVIYQHYPRITLAIRDKTFFENPAIISAIEHAKKNNSSLNLVGLLSNGNVHASIDHLLALIKMVREHDVPLKLHLFADGKDGEPKSFEKLLARIPAEFIGSLSGRYYAMDREENWNLTHEAYRALVGELPPTSLDTLPTLVQNTYTKNGTEEFFAPIVLNKECAIMNNDAVFFFNFREDSIREIASSFIEPDFEQFPRTPLSNIFIATMTNYKETWKVPVAFPRELVEHPLGLVLSDAGKTQLRLAETYKYAHVTYFFNALKEAPYKNEYRVVLPSNPVPHPDEHPAMMAPAITDRLTQAIENRAFDFILVNYANGDTIAHTGNFKASEEAVRIIDQQLDRILPLINSPDIALILTSDHGNIEELTSPETGRMETGHDPNPVPCYVVTPEFKGKKFAGQERLLTETGGILSDIAPTVLELLGVQKPVDMTGESLLKNIL